MNSAVEERILSGLDHSGFAVVPNAFDASLIAQLRGEFRDLIEADRFHRAGIGRDLAVVDEVRRDAIFWFEPTALSAAQESLWRQLETLRSSLNQNLFLGLWDLEGHFAHYAAGGFYRRHLDRFKDNNGRAVSLVLYLNEKWQESDGGRLRLYPPTGGEITIDPQAGTLVLFLSDRIEHEVLESHADRMSFAAWFRHRT